MIISKKLFQIIIPNTGCKLIFICPMQKPCKIMCWYKSTLLCKEEVDIESQVCCTP